MDMPESLSSSTHTHFPVDDFGGGCSGTGTIGPPLALRGSAGGAGKGAVEEALDEVMMALVDELEEASSSFCYE